VVAWFLQGPVDGCEVSFQDEIVPGAKTMTPLRVWPEVFISGKKFKVY
jgi:hypothetical protein